MTDHKELIARLRQIDIGERDCAEAADAIEALQAKVVQLKVDADRDYATMQELCAEVERLKLACDKFSESELLAATAESPWAVAEREQLRAEVERLNTEKPWLKEANETVRALTARLTALESQEPVGYVRTVNGKPEADDDNIIFCPGNGNGADSYGDEVWKPLFLAAGAAPRQGDMTWPTQAAPAADTVPEGTLQHLKLMMEASAWEGKLADAKRYRWLREGAFTGKWLLSEVAGTWTDGMDKAVDRAMSEAALTKAVESISRLI